MKTRHVADKAREEIAGEAVEGFPGARGIVEGPDRVIMHHDGFPKLKTGDILVCPFTSPACTPLFPKIIGAGDSGGMLTHAPITVRESSIPAGVGTWVATGSIRDSDVTRVDGNEDIMQIIPRA
jgi:pyruvate,water dikinase